jgi:hypothetical protein
MASLNNDGFHDPVMTVPYLPFGLPRSLVWRTRRAHIRLIASRVILVVLFLTLLLYLTRYRISLPAHAVSSSASDHNRKTDQAWQLKSTISTHSPSPPLFNAFRSPEPVSYRDQDIIDTFHSYEYRGTCDISSLDLHAPFGPLCLQRKQMLTAMSSGGRIGFDAPYMPRDCDMRWFSTEEICEILGRFDKVVIVGDSMMRHVLGGINILIRKNLGYGAVTDWNFSQKERYV